MGAGNRQTATPAEGRTYEQAGGDGEESCAEEVSNLLFGFEQLEHIQASARLEGDYSQAIVLASGSGKARHRRQCITV